ncbi:MAG: class I SAM-dependent methyltransferase [Actinomycetota bacterium]|nr:class I SAM-dependent methyltransferase [Actinomycetota bacterium]
MSWEDVHQRTPWGTWPDGDVVRVVSRLVSHGPLRILDIGCGNGAQHRLYQAVGHWAVGLDRAEAALARLRRREEVAGPRLPLVRADARNLPFREGFDLVVDAEALCYLAPGDHERAWREMARVIQPGGLVMSLAFTTGCYPCGGTKLREVVSVVDEGPLAGLGPTTFLGEQVVNDRVRSSGLTLEDLQKRSRTIGPAHLVVEEWVVLAAKPTP